MLRIYPRECLMDEYISIKVSQLQPGQHITLRCEVIEGKFVFDSHAYFVASLDGVVDLSNDGSFGGSYLGISQMGIFWSMVAAKGQMNGLRYFPRSCMEPMNYKLQIYDGHLSEESFQKSELLIPVNIGTTLPIVEDVVLRKCNAEGVTRREVKYGRVRGTIFKPPGPGPFKGVIDIYGAAGGINESRVALLASRGFIAFTLPHHNYDDLVGTMDDVEIEYFLEAVKYFSSLGTVQPNVGILCACAGGSIGLFLCTICPEVSTVIAISSVYFHVASVNYQGKPFVNFGKYCDQEGYTRTRSVDHHGGYYWNELLYHTPIDNIAIKIEQSNAKILLLAGADDKSVNAVASGKYMVDRMKKHGKGSQITLLYYPGVGHFIDPPFMPQTVAQYYPLKKTVVAVGGHLIENASANVHCWKQILSFLRRNVGLPSML